jgi:hypothetical protein
VNERRRAPRAGGIKGWPAEERPRERLAAFGPSALSDAELLALLLGTGARGRSAVDLGRDLLRRLGALPGFAQRLPKEFAAVPGVGAAKAAAVAAPLDLYPRTRFAEQHDADVLVSIHANALPDGVNPFVSNGTSVYYFHPRSAPLARELDRALVAELGVRDLGMGRGDYAVARPTWMPAALTEGLFIMMPEQEAMLLSEDGQWRYARGVVRGIERFLRDRAREP